MINRNYLFCRDTLTDDYLPDNRAIKVSKETGIFS